MKQNRETYYAQTAGWILDGERRKGEAIEATPEEAKFALAQGTIALTRPASKEEEEERLRSINATPDHTVPVAAYESTILDETGPAIEEIVENGEEPVASVEPVEAETEVVEAEAEEEPATSRRRR